MLSMGKKELYPIGTDILTKYIGRDSKGLLLLDNKTSFDNNGNIIAGNNATSSVYIPVNLSYKYTKGARRISLHYYDKNYNYLGNYSNTWEPMVQTLPTFPQDTVFIRCAFLIGPNANWNVDITRIE